MKTIVELKNLSKIYNTGEKEFKALDNIDLSIGKGEFVVILGPSGAGKSTLLNLIGGMDTPTNGSIKIDGEEISKYNENKLSEFIVTTNRNLSEEIKNFFVDNKINWELIPDDKQNFLIAHIGSEENCKTFFENCKFYLLKKNYNELDEELYENYARLYNDQKPIGHFSKNMFGITL